LSRIEGTIRPSGSGRRKIEQTGSQKKWLESRANRQAGTHFAGNVRVSITESRTRKIKIDGKEDGSGGRGANHHFMNAIGILKAILFQLTGG